MYVPTNLKEIGEFGIELINKCSVSMKARIERGAAYRNSFLTGSPDGVAQTYKKTYAYVDDLASMLYSPVELKLAVAPHGKAGPIDRAMGHAAASRLNEELRTAEVDSVCEDAVLWSLVKGKTLVQLVWTKRGFEPHLIMPESFGVMEEGKSTLDQQKAFFQRTWMTLDNFADRVARNPNRDQLMKSVQKYALGSPDKEETDQNYATTRMVMMGSLYPYQVSSSPIPSGGSNRGNRGVVDWLSAPEPQLAPESRAQVVAFDEVWAWDSSTEDWVTIQLCGPDCVVTPYFRLFNAFAEAPSPGDRRRIVPVEEMERRRESNPLTGKHPFIEFCVNRTPQYFWGDSEVRIVGSLQTALNARLDGINKVLRKQENPPRIISGTSINQNALSRLNKPGGYLTDPSPNMKHEELTPQVPHDFWASLDRYEGMFNTIGGMPSVVRGEGESGVRSQGHADTLVRMASPRFKDRALAVERSIDRLGALALDMLKAHVPEKQIAWVKEAFAGPFASQPLDPMLYEPPAKGLFGILFNFYDLAENQRVSVDAHSSSPIFSQDARNLIFTLAKLQAISPKEVIELTHPPREEELIENFEEREAEKAALIKAHPELLEKGGHGGRRR